MSIDCWSTLAVLRCHQTIPSHYLVPSTSVLAKQSSCCHGNHPLMRFCDSMAVLLILCLFVFNLFRDRHGRPWGFFGPPMPIPEKNCTQTLGHGKFMGMGKRFSQVSVFLRVFWVIGFQVMFMLGYDKKRQCNIYFSCNKKNN